MKIKKQNMKTDCAHSPVYDKQTGGSKCRKCGMLLNDFNQEYKNKTVVSKYKNELGTLNSDRLLQIHNFVTAEHKKGNYELYVLFSDFAEQQESYIEPLLKEKEDEITQLKSALSKAQSKITEMLIERDELKRK